MTHELPEARELEAMLNAGTGPLVPVPEPSAALVEVRTLEQELQAIAERTKILVVKTAEEEVVANESFILATALEKKIDERRLERTRPLREERERLDAQYNAVKERVHTWVTTLRNKILDYRSEQKRLADEAERKRQEEIRRLLDEQNKRDEEARRKRDAERLELEANAREASRVLKEGLGIELEVPPEPVPDRPSPQPTVLAPPPPPPIAQPANTAKSTSGAVSGRQDWKWKVQNLELVPREHFVLDVAKITRLVKAGARTIPGIEIYAEENLSATRKRT